MPHHAKQLYTMLLLLLALPLAAQDYTLVWNEDFTDASLDLNVWNIEVNGDGGGNSELQYYCEKGVTLGTEPTTGKKCLVLTAPVEYVAMIVISFPFSAFRS